MSTAQMKTKKLKTRTNKSSKRKRRINSEKHIEERDDEIPWPVPNESAVAVALYKQLIENANFSFPSFEQPKKVTLNLKSEPATTQKQKDQSLIKVHEKLDRLLEEQSASKMSSVQSPPRAVPRAVHSVGSASSEDLRTLFSKPCSASSTLTGGRQALPPIGVFWDIENCSVPKGRSALVAVQRMRERFFSGHYEAEFVCVCDIRKESPSIIQELNDAQVSVVHVSGNSKNAADDKLRQAMRRFADIYSSHPVCPSSPFPATIILISGDVNFSSDLSDLRYRKRLYVILLHNKHAADALLICAHEQYEFHSLLSNLPPRPTNKGNFNVNASSSSDQIPLKGGLLAMDVLVCDLPYANSKTHVCIKNRLRKLSENCGGKVVTLQGQFALVRFPNKEAGLRATKRMNGEDVLGSKIRVLYSSQMEFKTPQNGIVAPLHPSTRNRELSTGPAWKPTWKNKSTPENTNFWPTASRNFINQIKPQVPFDTLKKEVASLLQDVPGACLPLFKFREMFDKRYRRSVSCSDLYRMRDVVAISENTNAGSANSSNVGRSISLSSEWKSKEDKQASLYCELHPPKKTSSEKIRTGWAEKEADILLPNVKVEFGKLAVNVRSLLNSHGGSLPLISFLDCYESEFNRMERAFENSGVPLEHLLSCVQGVEITQTDNGMKRVRWSEKKDVDTAMTSYMECSILGLGGSQPLATQLAQFGREMIDLLKTFPKCSLAFSKLIPAYHHHFGRQCRVADYGHFNLQSLLQTLPHVVQIMGSGQDRILTLSHKAQMKRFATDLLRVLKAHGGAKKQIKIEEFPEAFSHVFVNRQFNPEDYGLCNFWDLINELIENSTLVALLKDDEGNQMLAVPKREQTPQEIHKTRIFASEVIELLRHCIRYEMPFSKFIPAYHHHFGKQCRVSDYGFAKLAELFEAISDTVVCENQFNSSDCNTEDRLITLILEEQVKVVGEHLVKLVEKQGKLGKQVMLNEIDELFLEEHGFQLRPEMCDATDIEDLVSKLGRYVSIEGGKLTVVDRVELENRIQDIIAILEHHSGFKMDLSKFLTTYRETYGSELTVGDISKNLSDALILTEEDGRKAISLAPLRVFAREIVQLLEECGGSLMIPNVETGYLQKFGQPIRPAQMGFPSLLALLQAIPEFVQVTGKTRVKRVSLAGQSGGESSFEEGPHVQKSRFDSYKERNGLRSHSGDHAKFSSIRNDSGRWSDSPKFRRAPPPPLFAPMQSPGFNTGGPQDSNIFSFEGPAALSPSIYDLWMRESMAPPGIPPLSPPVVWTYHPIVYPPATPPGTAGNIMMPTHFTYGGPWSPHITSTCYEQISSQTPNGIMAGEFVYDQQNQLANGIERIALGLDGRNEV